MNPLPIFRPAAFVALALLAIGAARAQPIVIDQAAALSGSPKRGDEPGFPVTIANPGHYVLGSDLDVPAYTRGIEIKAPDVTLDLNGFALRSTGECQQQNTYAVQCNTAYTLYKEGIWVDLRHDQTGVLIRNVVLRNGTVRGFSGDGIFGGSRFENLRVLENRGTGIRFGDQTEWRRISDTLVTLSGHNGISGADLSIEGSQVLANGAHGVYGQRLSVSDSLVTRNFQYGLAGYGSPTSTVRNTTLVQNKQAQVGGFTSAGGNSANGAAF